MFMQINTAILFRLRDTLEPHRPMFFCLLLLPPIQSKIISNANNNGNIAAITAVAAVAAMANPENSKKSKKTGVNSQLNCLCIENILVRTAWTTKSYLKIWHTLGHNTTHVWPLHSTPLPTQINQIYFLSLHSRETTALESRYSKYTIQSCDRSLEEYLSLATGILESMCICLTP